jgi:hypothetical protein
MEYINFKKGIVVGIVVLFIGAGAIPSICGQEKNKDNDKISYGKFMETMLDKSCKNDFRTSSNELIQQTCQVPPNILWDKTFGGEYNEYGVKIRKTTDDGFVILGMKDNDFWLIKLDENGDEIWNNTYGNPSLDEFPTDVQQTSDGGYIIVGYYFFFHEHDTAILLVKTNSDGSLVWSKTFGSEYQPCNAFSVYQTSDNGYLIFGNSGLNSDSLYLIKADVNGDLVWEKYVAGPGGWLFNYDSAKTDDGYVVTGCILIGYSDLDMFVMSLSSDLDKQWFTTFGGELFDYGLSVIQSYNGKYAVAGVADSPEFDYYHGNAWIVQFDNQGNVDWDRVIEGDHPEILYSIKETKSGFVAVGTIFSTDPEGYNMLVILTDNNGYEYEKWSIGGNSYDEGNYVYVNSDGDYIITGYTASYGTQNSADLWLLKIEEVSINLPPNAPDIDGPTQGRMNIYYIWSFTSTDPDNDNIEYYINWGDGTFQDWDGPYKAGKPVNFSHKYDYMGDFVIKAKARDEFGNEGEYSELNVNIPRNRPYINNFDLLFWIFEHFPNISPLLRYLLGLA